MVAVDDRIKERAAAAAQVMGRLAPLRAAYLFGSQVQGTADRWSDIDVAGFIEGLEAWDPQREKRLIIQVQREVGYDVEPHVFSAQSITHPQPGTLARQILRDGLKIL